MQKITIFLLLTFLFTISASFSQEVSNFDDFKRSYNDSDSQCEITLCDDIEATDVIGSPNPSSVVIHGESHILDGCGNYRGFIAGVGKSLHIDSLTVQNFSTESMGAVLKTEVNSYVDVVEGCFRNNESHTDGGVIFNQSVIDNIKGEFSSNYATTNGGAVYNDFSGTITNIEGTFSNNTAIHNAGGAIFNFGVIGNINANFNSNTTELNNGGAIFNIGDIMSLNGVF